MSHNTVFERLLEVLRTGRGSDGRKKDIVVCPDEKTFSFDRLSRKDAIRLLEVLKSTKVTQISIHLSEHCADTVPRRFRKLFRLRGDCMVGIIPRWKFDEKKKRKKPWRPDIIYVSPSTFNPRFIKDTGVSEYIEVIRADS
jgi:hypothetical protein